MGELDDYGNSLDDSLAIANATNATSTQNLANVAGAEDATTYLNSIGANTDYGSTTGDGSAGTTTTIPGSNTAKNGIAGLKKFVTDNKALIATAGALTSVFDRSSEGKKTGYQGGIPQLAATRNMISAPPTKAMGYRPGAGGIDYGGDVTYSRMPKGMETWANLSGNTGTSKGANLGGLGSLDPNAKVVSGGTGVTTVKGGTGVTTVKGGTGVDTIKGGTTVDTIKGGTTVDTITGAKGNDTITKENLGSVGYQNAMKAGLTPAQYLNNINQWIIDNPRASKAQIDAAMKQFGVSDTDLQEALRTTNFSDYTKYGLTHGMGLQDLNFAISNFVEKNPYATNAQIQTAMKAAGVNDEDIARGLNALSASAGKEYAIINDMGLDTLYKNILDYQAAGHSPAEVAAVMSKYGIEQRDVNKANQYAIDTGYKADAKSYAGVGDYRPANEVAWEKQQAENARLWAAKQAENKTNWAAQQAASQAVQPTVQQSVEQPVVQNTASVPLDTSNEIYQYFANPETQAALASGNTQGIAETMQELGYSPAEVAAATGTNVADVQAAYDAALSQGSTNTSSSNSGSSNEIYDYFASPEVQAALASGDTRGIAETMQARGYSPADVAAATGTNVADVQAAYDAALGIGQQDSYLYRATGGYLGYANGGEIAMAKGRYLQGNTDGMADKLPARIGRDQPAALSHGEFVIPADVVSHMGNGNSDAGAKKLYQMMDKIRMARTGNKKQGKKINPDKFMPGGLAQAYAEGGSVKHFVTGGTTVPAGTIGTESNLSNWVGDYTTNMLGQGQALANMPYQAYMGPLTAGESPLQTGAFGTASGLTTPSSIGNAATTAGTIATDASKLAYSPTTFTNQFTAPTASQATNFTNQYTAPGAYSPTTSAFNATQAQAYMNPYLQASLNPQLDEARRQSQITQQQNAAKMTQAGAFGGGRQAILDAETQRSLGTNLANITGQGYNTAYGNAMSQFNADQARKMQEAQFGSTQGMANAQLGAQFGLSAQQANEAARQFGAQQGMTGAQMSAQYGLAGQQAGEQSKQFGAGFGLQGLQAGLQAAQAQGALGVQQNQVDINNLNAQLTAGVQQRGIESEGIAADKAQFEEARANPYKMIQYQQSLLQGLPLAAQSYQGISPSDLTKASQGATTVNQLLKNLGLA